jgi:steroid 5-alpha reductase family enzyme
MSKTFKTFVALLVFTILGLGVGYIAGGEGKAFQGTSIFFLCALWAFVVNWLVFIPSALAKTEKYYDLTGAFTYITMIILAVYLAQPLGVRGMVAAALVVIWSLRLGLFLFARVKRDKGDKRFDEIKVNGPRFLVAWTIQGTWVILTAACALAMITTADPKGWDVFATIGLILWIIGFSIEVTADAQKSAFRKDPENKSKFINTGLWARSQHPNYFGEILLWIGVAVMALPILSDGTWIALISPFFVMFLLLKVSGIPLLQKAGMKKWGDDPDYLAYRKNTPKLIPKLF